MSALNQRIHEINTLEELAERDVFCNRLHPVTKLIVTAVYLICLVSFPGYHLAGVLGMAIVPIVLLELSDIPIRQLFRQLKVLFALLAVVGIANPLLDREVVTHWGNLAVTGGMLSFLTLYLKGILALSASYLLIATTPMESICYGLQVLHLPKLLITVVLLIYRYLRLMIREVHHLSTAYALRAPGQKGVHWKVWGTLAGTLLLRSVQRAELLYESMLLRGFSGTFRLTREQTTSRRYDLLYAVAAIAVILTLRFAPIF